MAEPHALRFSSSGTEWFVLTIVDDREIENTEIINIALANPQPPDAVLELGTASITIIREFIVKRRYGCRVYILHFMQLYLCLSKQGIL